MKANKNEVLNFANLSNNNKSQFLQFLLKNNIKFQQTQRDFTANFSLPKNAKPIVKNMSNVAKNQNNYHKKTTIYKSKAKPLQQRSVNKQQIGKGQSLQKFAENSTFSNTGFSTTRDKFANKTFTPKKQTTKIFEISSISNQKITGKESKPFSGEKKLKFQQKMQENCVNQEKIKLKQQQQKQRLKQIKESEENRICKLREERLEKYLQIFKKKTNKRGVKWQICQLQKVIEQIYTQHFVKNTHSMQRKDFITIIKQKSQQKYYFACFIEKFFEKKFKIPKIVEYQLLSMLQTLAYYHDREIVPASLLIFSSFIFQAYYFEDLIFFLFARSMIQKNLKLSFNSISEKVPVSENKLLINLKDIQKILKSIIGNDSSMINEYTEMILSSISKASHQNLISVYTLLKVLVEDYRDKRIQQEQLELQNKEIQNDKLQQSLNSEDKQNEQLTFGQGHELQFLHQNSFWVTKSIFETTKSVNQVQLLISQKLKRKVGQLIQLLFGNYNRQLYQRVQKLVYFKSYKLLQIIFSMDKIQWFKQLMIKQPTQQDVEIIQNFQLSVRNLRSQPNVKDICDLCKNILTLKQFKFELQKLIL